MNKNSVIHSLLNMKNKLVQRVIRKYASFPHATPHSSFLGLLPGDFCAYAFSVGFCLFVIPHPIIALVESAFSATYKYD